MAYELFYAFTTTTTFFERASFLVWFELDLTFAILAVRRAHSPNQRWPIARNMILVFLAAVALLVQLTRWYPDDREQFTAYWTGILLQFPIGYCYIYSLWRDHDLSGQSLEIW